MVDVPAQFGRVSMGDSHGKAPALSAWAWYVWPADLNSLEAIIANALIGPFKNGDEAELFAKSHAFEKVGANG